MSEFAVILKPTRDKFVETITTEEIAVVERHFGYFKELYEKGRLKYAGRCEDGFLGLGIFEAGSEQEVREIMAVDPAICAGIMSHTVKAWRTALGAVG